MTDNQVISNARGECRHKWLTKQDAMQGMYFICDKCDKRWVGILPLDTDYSGDPSAWDDELYKWIEDEGLSTEMQYWLYTYNCDDTEIQCVKHSLVIGSVTMWELIKASPAQKASALAIAITLRRSRDMKQLLWIEECPDSVNKECTNFVDERMPSCENWNGILQLCETSCTIERAFTEAETVEAVQLLLKNHGIVDATMPLDEALEVIPIADILKHNNKDCTIVEI